MSQLKDESNTSQVGLGSNSRLLPIDSTRRLNAASEAALETKRNLQFWTEKAKVFITSAKDDDLPIPVPLKQVIDRPPTAEQKMRSLKEQQMIKEKIKEKEEKVKRDALERERKAIKAKGPINYDYEGNYFEIRPSKLSDKQAHLVSSVL